MSRRRQACPSAFISVAATWKRTWRHPARPLRLFRQGRPSRHGHRDGGPDPDPPPDLRPDPRGRPGLGRPRPDPPPMADVRGRARSAGREQGVENFYQRESERNIRGGLAPAFESQPRAVEAVDCIPVTGQEGLFVLPGHIRPASGRRWGRSAPSTTMRCARASSRPSRTAAGNDVIDSSSRRKLV